MMVWGTVAKIPRFRDSAMERLISDLAVYLDPKLCPYRDSKKNPYDGGDWAWWRHVSFPTCRGVHARHALAAIEELRGA